MPDDGEGAQLMAVKREENPAASSNNLRGGVLRVLGVLKVATVEQIQQISAPHLSYRHTGEPTLSKRKQARTPPDRCADHGLRGDTRSPTATGPHVDSTGAQVVGEVGLLEYNDCQVSAIHDLRDIFRVASEYAVGSADLPSVIRVGTWAVSATDDGPVLVCTSDTHPERAHRLSHVIIPPSLVVPELMASVVELTDWLVGLRCEGTTLCAVCAGVFVLAETHLLDFRDATTHAWMWRTRAKWYAYCAPRSWRAGIRRFCWTRT
ncbi:hypothetical protein AB0E62_39620 [Streptomyces sp. NPDC038707]|uniref:hypothetical protein n=1 Tax=Streptomyces sp. NPDC038707 TaxID=3154329 RepID=UPI0033F6F3B9